MKLTAAVVCDLCHHNQPSLYCSSDSAFLCIDCDSKVHSANFLVARHIRVPICKSYDAVGDDNDDDDALSSSSSSSSSTVCTNSKTRSANIVTSSFDWKTRDVLVNWCSRLGVGGSSRVIEVAKHAFKVWWMNRSEWPYRVGLAASLWLGFTKRGYEKKRIRMRSLLKKLEEISGVPAKSIVVEQLKLAGMLKKMKRPQHQEESWAEC